MEYKHHLYGKRVLFFSPAFFNYEKLIKDKIIELGADVDYYDERSVSRPVDRALLKISPNLFKKKTEEYYDQIIQQHEKQNYDYILIVRADMISVKTLKKIKQIFPNAKVNLYLWDSFKNIVGIKSKLPYFDKVFSFDRKDAESEKSINFRPLFFADVYANKKEQNNKYEYKVCFIGTVHSDRYGLIKKIRSMLLSKNNKIYVYMFIQSRWIFYIHKLFKKDFRKAKMQEFNTESLSMMQVSEIEAKSEIILDIQHPKQSGLTMRTIEMLGMQKKIITTNSEIMMYDFYNPNNICVIDRKNPVINKNFLTSEFAKTDDDIYEKYSLNYWVDEVLS